MKFSGHETFPVREGWLHKGMKLLMEDPQKFQDPEIADHLGVGKNMAKSIKHWLLSTGLAVASGAASKGSSIESTSLGQVVWQNDPYFIDKGTWWILHANLVNNVEGVSTWSWFFNNFRHERFDKAVCLESLMRFIELAQKRVPSPTTLNRDLGCMLASYAREIPAQQLDPEDGADCPFRELDLLSFYPTSESKHTAGHYHFHHGMKDVSESIFGYVVSVAYPDIAATGQKADIRLADAVRKQGGPGSVFGFSSESLFETISKLESDADAVIQIGGMAGERTMRIPSMTPIDWVERSYKLSFDRSFA